jgi:sugar (pentulose or hexulose) kinase
VASGVYGSISEACKRMVHMKKKIEPEDEKNEQYTHYYGLYKEAYRDNAELMHRLR